MRKFGLIGYPLTHSFSQQYFTQKFQQHGIDAEYLNFPLRSLDELTDIIHQNPELEGFNVTIPYKTRIIQLLSDICEESQSVQAVNTVRIERIGSNIKLHGFNTDVRGFRESILPHLSGHQEALILGTGGAAKAAYHVLTDLNIDCECVSRNPELGDLTYDELDSDTVWEHSIIVNCTPVGMYPNVAQRPDLPYHAVTPEHLFFDMIYNPKETEFLSEGRKRRATCVNGMEMLELQAEGSWNVWNSL